MVGSAHPTKEMVDGTHSAGTNLIRFGDSKFYLQL